MDARQEETLTTRAAKGFLWNTLGLVLSQPVGFLTTIILARILDPKAFGLVNMAAVPLGVAALLNDLGLGVALIQRRHIEPDEIDSVFWLNLAVGVALTAVAAIFAGLFAAFYREPSLTPVLAVSGLNMAVSSLLLVPQALLSRRLEFKKVAVGSFLAVVTNSAVAIALAALGSGVWSLVLGGVASGVVQAAYVWRASRWWPSLRFSWHRVREYASFGGVLTIATIVNYASWNVDYLLIGRYLGAAEVGLYFMAFNLVMMPSRKIASTVAQSLLPAFAQLQDESERFRRGYVKTVSYVSLPAAILLGAAVPVARDLIVGVYGEAWVGAVTPFRLMVVVGYLTAVTTMAGLVFKGLKRPKDELAWGIAMMLGTFVGVGIGLRHGIVGVAVGVTAAMVLTRVPMQFWANRLVAIPASAFLTALSPSFVAGIFAAAVSMGSNVLLRVAGVPGLPSAMAGALLGAVGSWFITRRVSLTAREAENLMTGVLRDRFASSFVCWRAR